MLPSSDNNWQRNTNKENWDCVYGYFSGHFGSDSDILQITRAGGSQHSQSMTLVNLAHGIQASTAKSMQFGNLLVNTIPQQFPKLLALTFGCHHLRHHPGRAIKNNKHVKGYIPRITASRHLIGKDSLVISFAVSINLGQKQKGFQSFQLQQLTGVRVLTHSHAPPVLLSKCR